MEDYADPDDHTGLLADEDEDVEPEQLGHTADPEGFESSISSIDPEELGDTIENMLSPVPKSPRPKFQDGEHSRYVMGHQSQTTADDLRPAPLNSGLKSFREMLEEGPPEDEDNHVAPPASPTDEQDEQINKSKFASLRKLKESLSTKKTTESKDRAGLRSLFSPSSRKYVPNLDRQDSDGSPGLLATSTQTSNISLADSSSSAVRPTTAPVYPSSVIYGEPPSAMTRPVIPSRATSDHLNSTTHPPVSEDNIATPSKDIEPVLPASEQSNATARRPELRRCHSSSAITKSGGISGQVSYYPLPVPQRSRDGAIKKYDRKDPQMATLDALARDAIEEKHISDTSTMSALSLVAPETPKNRHHSPITPEFLESYQNLQRNSKGSAQNSHRASNKQVSSNSPRLPRIQENDASVFTSPAQGTATLSSQPLPPARRLFATPAIEGQSSRAAQGLTGPVAQGSSSATPQEPTSSTVGANAPTQGESSRPTPAAEPNVSLAMANFQRYFSECTPESIHSARVAIVNTDDRVQVVNELRRLTRTEVVWHGQSSQFPKHPYHNRVFKSKNLVCIQHHPKCTLCGAACCVYAEAMDAFTEAGSNRNVKCLAKEAGELIKECGLSQADETTFIRCNDCYELVCQDCVSVCPVEICQLKSCKRCKPQMWEKCDWHDLV